MYANDTHALVFGSYEELDTMRRNNMRFTDYIEHMELPEELQSMWHCHPHCRGAIVSGMPIVRTGRELQLADRCVDFGDDVSQHRYLETPGRYTSISHHGQRKLLISEVEFLTQYGCTGGTVVYIGAAPGLHIPLLAEMFPYLRFVLFDDARFLIEASERVEIHNERFYVRDAKKYRGHTLISDIRSSIDDQSVRRDNELQKEIVYAMQPFAASLKFRMPFDDRDYTALSLGGKYYYQPWVGESSSETRIFWDCSTSYELAINSGLYEDLLYKHNCERKRTLYDNLLRGLPYMDGCYDCSSEGYILQRYIDMHTLSTTQAELSWRITSRLSRQPCV